MSPTGSPIGVGIIGLSTSGWASQAHVGGLAPLKGKIELKALSTRSAESAEAAGRAHGVKAYHGDPSQIANDPNVDLVVVAVNVGAHRDAVWPAIEAGKDVFVEWPLGVDYQEAREIADFAEQKGVRTMVGLQARQSPAVKKVKELVDNGSIGRVLSSSLVGAGGAWGPAVPSQMAYLQDAKSGGSLLSIPLMHTLDGISTVLGEFKSISALESTQITKVQLADKEDETLTRTSPDNILLHGQLQGGAVMVVQYKGASGYAEQGGFDFRWEILGDKGTIVVKADIGHMQLADLQVFLNNERVEVADDGQANNVGRSYALFADRKEGEYTDFAHAVRRHALIAAIQRSARDGVRVDL